MERDEAICLIALGILAAGDCKSRRQACEDAEELLDDYLRDAPYRIEGIEVPAEFVTDMLETVGGVA